MTIRSLIRSPIRSLVSSALGGGGGLLGQATSQLGGVAPYHYWDFINNRALFAQADVGGVTSTPGWSFTRASAAEAQDAAGNFVQFASGELRRTDKGILIEGARTNLFLNSLVGATQVITAAAVAYTLSFYGTGTITLSGVSTAGPLVGTGANNRVTLTFTPTAGALTCTVTGSCTRVQLEAGAFASSHILTAGASATRAADVLTVSSPGVNYPLGMFAEFERVVDTGNYENIFGVDDGTSSNRTLLFLDTSDQVAASARTATVEQLSIPVTGAVAIGAATKSAIRMDTNNAIIARGGTLSALDNTVTLPPNPTRVTFSPSQELFGYLRRTAIFNFAPSDAQLQAMTT